jgi:hypothetical protein
MYIYYQPTEYPTHHPLPLYMCGGNGKKPNGPKLPARIEKNGKTYLIIHNPKNPRDPILKEIK